MTYQPYPTSGGSNQPYPAGGDSNLAERPPQPQSLRIAVILMYVGAALSAVSLIISLALSGRIKSAVGTAARKVKTTKPLTATQIHSLENFYLVLIIVILLIAIGLWLWMAWANGRGKGWARILASVFFGFNTLWLVFSVGRTGGPAIFIGIGWLVGLAALIFLWRRDTTQYIAQSQ
ncbi:MAG TPA: hypothetical protein VEV45_19230 [Streptosporangiaceae bacterium]|nr:hypothetical protein [Streptosporangiaceae bacterium]